MNNFSITVKYRERRGFTQFQRFAFVLLVGIAMTLEGTVMPTLRATPSSSCGGLVQEAEDGTLSGNFVIGNDITASGGQYIHVPNGTTNRFSGPDASQSASYCVQIDTAGAYNLKGGSYATSSLDNSFYVQVDGNPVSGFLWEFPKNTDYQHDPISDRGGADPVEVNLSAGEHTITFFLRENGARLDMWELQLVDSTPLPTGCQGLVVEAETGELTGSFVVGNDSSASGGQYIHVPEGTDNSFSGPDSKQKAEYCVQVDNPGIYRIKGNIYAEDSRDNSFFVQVDASPTGGYLWDFSKSTGYEEDYVSDRNGDDPVEVSLAAGEHFVSIFLREDGAQLDKFELEQVTQSTALPVEQPDQTAELAHGIYGSLNLVETVGAASISSLDGVEIDLSRFTLTLMDAETLGANYLETTRATASGEYYFDEMPVGDYLLSIALPRGYGSRQATEISITTSAEQMVEHSFQLHFALEHSDNEVKMVNQLFLPLIRR